MISMQQCARQGRSWALRARETSIARSRRAASRVEGTASMNGGAGRPLERNAPSGGARRRGRRSCPALPNARRAADGRGEECPGAWMVTLGRPSDGSDAEVTISSTWSPGCRRFFRAVVCPAGALADVAGSHWLNRRTDETGGGIATEPAVHLGRDQPSAMAAWLCRYGCRPCLCPPGTPAGTGVTEASLRLTGSGSLAGVFRGGRGCGGGAGRCTRMRAGPWRADGAEDGFIGTRQLVIHIPQSADRPAHSRHCPPRTLAATCRCHRYHLSVVRDGLCVKPLLH